MENWKSPLVRDAIFGSKKRFGVLLFLISLLIYIYSSAHGFTLGATLKKYLTKKVVPTSPASSVTSTQSSSVPAEGHESLTPAVYPNIQKQNNTPTIEQRDITVEKKEISVPLPVVTVIPTIGPVVEKVVDTMVNTVVDSVEIKLDHSVGSLGLSL